MIRVYRDIFIKKMKSLSERLMDKYVRTKNKGSYDDLSPLSDIEAVDSKRNYREALDFAFDNNNITNFSITGPYGSGKSSLIRSYIDYKGIAKDNFMIITLATFVNKSDKIEQPINEIESSILEQIVYNKEEDSHNYSKLNRINAPQRGKLLKNFFGACFLILTIIPIFSDGFSSILTEVIDMLFQGFGGSFDGVFSIDNVIIRSIVLGIIIVIDAVIFFTLFRKLRFISKVTFSFDKTKFELCSNSGNSLLDKHIDEIYNFFKHNKYRIVVFEDLDRYNNIDIFERLKRINRLINSSRLFSDKNDQVKFLYTVGDHLFENDKYKERTKFFDFVIPLVPVINTRNSFYELNEKFSSYSIEQKPDKKLLKDVSFYIDDMRTLKNIVNEYKTYYNLLISKDDKYFANKVFAIICFKNRYPSEFVLFQKNEGKLIELILKIDELKSQSIQRLDLLIQEIEQDIINASDELAMTKMQIDDIFRMHLYRMAPTGNIIARQGNTNIKSVNNRNQLMIEDDIAEFFSGDSIYVNGRPIDFKNANTLGGTSITYEKRIKYIELKNEEKLSQSKYELNELRNKKRLVTYQNWSEIIRENSDDAIIVDFQSEYRMVYYFIYNGFIEKDYIRYLGFFKEGHMTNHDTEFISSLRIMQDIKPSFKIDNPDEIVEELVTGDFTDVRIMNYYLIQYLLNNEDERIDLVLDSRKSDMNFMVAFINEYLDWCFNDGFIDNTVHTLIQLAYQKYENIWKYMVDNESVIEIKTHHIIDFFFGSLVAKEGLIKNVNHNVIHMVRYLQNTRSIANILNYCNARDIIRLINLYSGERTFAFKDLIVFKVKKVDIDELFDYVVERNLYNFNSANIIHLLNRKYDKNQSEYSFAELFAAIQEEDFDCLKLNLENNKKIFLDEYLVDFLNDSEMPSEAFIYLLEVISTGVQEKEKIVTLVNSNVKIRDLNEVNVDLYRQLMQSNHVESTFENVYLYLDLIGYDEALEQFIFQSAEELLATEIGLDEGRKYFIMILNSSRNKRIIEFLKKRIEDLKLMLFEFSSDISHLITLLEYDFNFVVDENSEEVLDNNKELLHQYLRHYYHGNLYAEMNLFISPEISSDLFQSEIIGFDEFYNLSMWQLNHYEGIESYLMEASSKLDNSKFKMVLNKLESKEVQLEYLHEYITQNKYSKGFLLDTLSQIDDSYEKFTTKSHFVVEYSFNLKKILEEIVDDIITSFSEKNNGKLHIYMNRKKLG
ncbi:MAG: hypothetical protein ACOWWR_08650 [Eubacteriales bacterium]